jgi:hypothetical protein
MAYFHAIENGRRCKCAIRSLVSEEGEVSGQQAIQEHVYKLYMELMGSEEPKFLKLETNYWSEEEQVLDEENEALGLSFTMKNWKKFLRTPRLPRLQDQMGSLWPFSINFGQV